MVNFNSFSSHSIDSCWSLPFPTELGPYFIISIWWMFLWMILLSNTMVSLNRRFGREHRRPHKSKEHLIRIFFNISQIGRNTYTCRSCTLPLAKRLSCDLYQCFLGKPSCRSQMVLCRTFAALLKAPKQFMTLAARFAGFLSKDFHGFAWGISLLTLAGRGDLIFYGWPVPFHINFTRKLMHRTSK